MRNPTATLLVAALLAVAPAGAAPPPGDNLVSEGIPEVPEELAAAVARYQNARSAFLFDWHPAERRMLVGTRFADTYQVHEVAEPGGARTQRTFFSEPVSCAAYVPADPTRLVVCRDVGGSEYHQLYRLDLTDGSTTLLTDGESKNSAPTFSRAGDRLAFTSTRRNGTDLDLYLMDPAAGGGGELLLEVEGRYGVLDWSPDDRELLVYRYVSVNQTELYVVDVAEGVATQLTARQPGEREVAYRNAVFGPDGQSIYVVADRDAEFQRLGVLDREGGFSPLSADVRWDVTDFDVSDDGAYAAYVLNEGGRGALRLLDLRSGAELPVPALPVGQVGDLEFRPDSHELCLRQSTDRTPGDVYTLEVGAGEVVRWTTSEIGGLDAEAFPETEITAYPTFDEVDGAPRPIPLLITRPDPERHPGERPVLIRIHGGPESQARPGFLGSRAYLVNDLGIAYLQPNVRGSTGYGREYRNLDDGMLREDSVRDIGALLDWIATQPDLDPERVAVYGGSYGGYMVLASLVHYGDRLRCGIDYVGISNFVTFLENTKPYRVDNRRAEYGDERDPEMRAFLEEISPANRADRIQVPLFVSQGANDPRVPASEAEQIVEQVRANGQTVWYLLATDEGHGFRKKPNQDHMTNVMTMFLQTFLLGDGE